MPLHAASRRALPAFAAPSLLVALLLAAAPLPVAAGVPAYGEFLLYARANFTGAYRLPDSAFFANTTPRLNAAGEMAFNVAVIAGTTSQGLWWGTEAAGGIVYQTPADAFVFGVGLNEAGTAVFEQALSPQDGLWLYDPDAGPAAFATDRPLGASGWGSPSINAAGQLGYRADFAGDHAWVSWDGSPNPAIHAVEAGADGSSPFSFLFTPAFDDDRRIAGKVRRGSAGQVDESRPDEIRLFSADGSSVLLAADADAQPGSPYARFDNAVALTNDGRVAFIATLVAGGRGVFLTDGTTTVTLATEAGPDLSEIEFFAPAVDDAGLVAFRGKDEAGLRAIWVGDGTTLTAVVREHDLLPTDLGLARVDQHDGGPVFSGGVSINAAGDVAFAAGLTPPGDDQIEWGTGAFVALAVPRTIFADGFESGDTSGWSAVEP